jgi:renalase
MTIGQENNADVVILGAGLAGLTAATVLRSAGKSVVLVDKGRYPGGRVNVSRLGSGVVNASVQSAIIGHPAAIDFVRAHFDPALWCQQGNSLMVNFALSSRESMISLAAGCEVQQGVVTTIERFPPEKGNTRWGLRCQESDELWIGSRLLLTAPLPQTLQLLEKSTIAFDPQLAEVVYKAQQVLICEVANAEGLDTGLVSSDLIDSIEVLSAQEQHSLVRVNSNAAWSTRTWGEDSDLTREALVKELSRLFPAVTVISTLQKRWKFANAGTTYADSFAELRGPAKGIVLAGDGFGPMAAHNNGVERAVLSGLAVANYIVGNPVDMN